MDQAATSYPLVLLHGFTQNALCWGELGVRLADGRQIVPLDLPGHGTSTGISAGLFEAADFVVSKIHAALDGPFDLLGYSLGGRVALHVALVRPRRLRRMIVVGSTPGISDRAARVARKEADEILAKRLDVEDPEGTVLDGFLREWLAKPMFRHIPPDRRAVEERRFNTAQGLASSLRLCGVGCQEPLWDRLAEIEIPTLVLSGAADIRFAEIGREMVKAMGSSAQLALVPGAGHACHLESPALTASLVCAFLDA